MRITSSVEYASRLMVSLARAHGQAAATAERLSEAENVPADYVNQLLWRLRRAGLVESTRGVGGGYTLSRKPALITLAQIIRAVDGAVFEGVCGKYDGGDKDCHHQSNCGISPVWEGLGRRIEEYLEAITLESLSAESPPCSAKVQRAPEAGKVQRAPEAGKVQRAPEAGKDVIVL